MTRTFTYIDWETENMTGYLTLNRPDELNSITGEMSEEIQEALKTVIYDESIRCLVLTGAGKAFCAGQNLAEITEHWEEPDFDLGDTVRQNYIPIIRMLIQMGKPVVCGVNGVAAGAGANLAFACDIITASENARFVQSFGKIGLVPDSGGTYLLPRLVGPHRAKQLIMLDEELSAQKAKDWGLVYDVYPQDVFDSETRSLAEHLASRPTRGFALTKKALNQTFRNTLDDQLELEAQLQSKAGETEDFKEGVKAFLEKRSPEFKGK